MCPDLSSTAEYLQSREAQNGSSSLPSRDRQRSPPEACRGPRPRTSPDRISANSQLARSREPSSLPALHRIDEIPTQSQWSDAGAGGVHEFINKAIETGCALGYSRMCRHIGSHKQKKQY